jgi:hypothetical protein
MEEVRDLLDNKPKAKGGLRIRQHPKKGFYGKLCVASIVESTKSEEILSYVLTFDCMVII